MRVIPCVVVWAIGCAVGPFALRASPVFAQGTPASGKFTRYFFGGKVGHNFVPAYSVAWVDDTRYAILNPGESTAAVVIRFTREGDGHQVTQSLTVAPRTVRTVEARNVPGLTRFVIFAVGLHGYRADFWTTVESDVPVVINQTVARFGDTRAGSGVETPSPRWYFAEGATHSGLHFSYKVRSASTETIQVRARFLRSHGAVPLEKVYPIPPWSPPIRVDPELVDDQGTTLGATDVSTVLESLDGTPFFVEREMYMSRGPERYPWYEEPDPGHVGAGVRVPALQWFLAEGATGPYFDLFILMANFETTAAQLEATYLLPDGTTVVLPYVVAANERFNIWVDAEHLALADTAVATIIRSTNGVPVVVERAMWWPGPTAATWADGHVSAGATETGTRWAVAEAEVDASTGVETYMLIANTSPFAGTVKVTLLFDDGTSAERIYADLPPRCRFNVPIGYFFPESQDRRFAVLVESVGAEPAQIVVERAMYWDEQLQEWGAGAAALAVKLP